MARKPNADLSDSKVVEHICAELISGKSLTAICDEPDMPSKSTVYQKMAVDDAFRTAIARAREAQQDALIDETVDMADSATPENWQVVKMRIWARQWRAAKLKPKTYGDKLDLNHSGSIEQLSDEEIDRRIARALAELQAGETGN